MKTWRGNLFLHTPFVILLINACHFVFCVEPLDTQTEQVSKALSPFQLRLCANHTISMADGSENQITIPTFSVSGNSYSYILEKYKVDTTNVLTTCPDGNSPTIIVTALRKATYDNDEKLVADNFSDMTVNPFLRSNNFLYQSGYLSVGNNGTVTYYSTSEYCFHDIRGQGDVITVDFKICQFNESRPIVRKCCPLGMAFGLGNRCSENRNSNNWDPGYMDSTSFTILPVEKVDPVFTWEKLNCEKENGTEQDSLVEDGCTINFHPVTGNRYAFLGVYRTWEFSDLSKRWCMDLMQPKGEPDRLVMLQCSKPNSNSNMKKDVNARISTLYMVNMYVGSVFHFMTTLVYLVTWKKQNIHGRTLCFCSSSLFFMLFTLGTAHLLGKVINHKTPVCIANAIAGQYFMIAAFTWLVVVNFDLWKTFGSIRSEGGKGLKRLLVYTALGWGFPAVVTIVSVSLDFGFPCRSSKVPVPEFGEHYCFAAPWAQGLYLYYILSFLMALSFVLSFLTWFGLYNFKKDNVNLRSTKSADDKQKYLLYLKLSVLMGLTWAFEVISWASTEENENPVVWIILDFYNVLSAILIFIFFVCKKTTLGLLEQSVPCIKRFYGIASILRLPQSFSRSVDITTTTTRTASK